MVIKELRLASTYKEVHGDHISVISRHLDYMMRNGIDICTQHEQLHKSPYGARFIAGSNKCTTKQLSSILTSNIITEHCEGIYRYTGVNCFWIIDNSKEVLDRLHTINKTSQAKSFDSYDFATLYTNIPHEALKNNIRTLIRETFKIRGFIVDTRGKAHWS